MQYVPGFSLIDLYDTPAPPPKREDWQALCDDGLQVLQYIVQNMDLRNLDRCIARNSVVHWDPIDEKWKCKLIDFGHCEFRETGMRKWEWRRCQASVEEEDAFARHMQFYLERKKGFQYRWDSSQYYEDLVNDFNPTYDAVEPEGYET